MHRESRQYGFCKRTDSGAIGAFRCGRSAVAVAAASPWRPRRRPSRPRLRRRRRRPSAGRPSRSGEQGVESRRLRSGCAPAAPRIWQIPAQPACVPLAGPQIYGRQEEGGGVFGLENADSGGSQRDGAELLDMVAPERRSESPAEAPVKAHCCPLATGAPSRRVLAAFLAPHQLWCVYSRRSWCSDPSPANARQFELNEGKNS